MKKLIFLAIFILIAILPFGLAYSTPTAATQNNTIIAYAERSYYLSVNLISQDPDPVEPGDYVELRWKVENEGIENTDDITFEILPEYPFSLVEGDKGIRKIGNLWGRQIEEKGVILYYKLKVNEDAVEGTNKIKLRYKIEGEDGWITLDEFDVRIWTTDMILSVEGITTEPEIISPGEKTKVMLKIKNMANSFIKNAQFKLDLTGTDFSPASASNEKTIKQIRPNAELTLEFYLITSPDAKSQPYKIPLQMTYYDQVGNKYSKNSTIGLIVNDVPDLLVNLEESTASEANTKIVLSVSNIGTSDIKFLTIEVKESEGYEIVSSPKAYLGNLESDDYETAEFEISLKKAKSETPLNVLLTYKDSYNKDFNKIEELAIKPSQQQAATNSSSIVSILFLLMVLVLLGVFWLFMLIDCIKNPMKGYKKILWMIIVLGAFVLGAAAYYLIARKKN